MKYKIKIICIKSLLILGAITLCVFLNAFIEAMFHLTFPYNFNMVLQFLGAIKLFDLIDNL